MGNDRSLVPAPHVEDGAQLASRVYTPPSITVHAASRNPEFNWEDAVRILQKSWRLSLVFALTVFVITTIVTFRMKDVYAPIARVEIDPPGADSFSLRDLLNSQTSDQDYLQTQTQILQSDELAVDVIRTMGLDRNPDIVGRTALAEAQQSDEAENPSRNRLTQLENAALGVFKGRLAVTPVRNSRLVEVSFSSHSPQLAAQVTNILVNMFIDRNYRTHYETTMQASEWLQAQLADLREKVEKSSQALVEYEQANGIVEVTDKENTVMQKAAEINHLLTLAQTDRITLEAYLKMVEAGAADSLPQIRNNYLINSLVGRVSDSRAFLAQNTAIYGKNHPNVRRIQSQVAEYEAALATERERVVRDLKASYDTARQREKLMTQALEEIKGVLGRMNEKMVHYNTLKNEALANAALYNALLARLKEAGISAGLKSSNIRVIDQARVLDGPTGPHRLLNMAMGLILGILGGAALAFLKEHLDNTIRTPDDIKALTGFSALAMFPLLTSRNGDESRLPLSRMTAKLLDKNSAEPEGLSRRKFFLEQPRSPEAEAVQSLHTSIMLSRAGHPPRTILIVSPSPGEGKTTVALNLAAVLASHGPTCLVDCDLRRPAIGRSLELKVQQGLSHVLTGSAELESVLLSVSSCANLAVLPVGLVPPNPGELIASQQMREILRRLREKFQYVVIDSPPLIPFADARALSPLTDGVVIVGRFGGTTRRAIARSTEMLAEVGAPVLGVVLNAVDLASPDYQYYHYGYGPGSKNAYGDGDGKAREEDL
jgi:polysaccharide biosynthesis transport protein